MKTSTKRVLAAVALLAVACASAASAQKTGDVNRDGAHFYGLNALFTFDGINVDWRENEVVGMNVLQRDGSWLPLRQQSSPTCAPSCAAGQKLSCWQDERQTTRVCVCTTTSTRGINGVMVDVFAVASN